jgi:undecaprenyl-diphosphatase
MDSYLAAALLGLVEGLTEFLPISSTGHLILVGDVLDFQAPPGKVFEVAIQLGAILAVIAVYFSRLSKVAVGVFHDAGAQRFVRNILLGFLPAAVLGAVLHSYIKEHLFNPQTVAIMLLLGGIFIITVDKLVITARFHAVEDFSVPFALKVGLCQAVSMIPGVSRSGATIMGAWLLGADRRAAMEFSFFLAIPTMLGATVLDFYKNWGALHEASDSFTLIGIGFITAFITALLVVRGALSFIQKYGFTPFGYYRIALGGALLFFT